MEGDRFFHPTFVEIVTDFFAFEADEIEAVDALVDFLAVEHAPLEFVDANAEEIFVVLFYFAPAGFVAWKIFVFGLVVGGVVDIILGAALGRPSRAFLFGPWHFAGLSLPDCVEQAYINWLQLIMNGIQLVNSNSRNRRRAN